VRRKLTVLACTTCGQGLEFEVKDRRRSVLAGCRGCGASVKIADGAVATVEVDLTDAEVSAAVSKAVEPSQGTPSPAMAKRGATRWRFLRFRVTDQQRVVVHKAMRAIKELRGLDGRSYHGTALELIAADLLSGIPQEVLDKLDAEDAAAKAAAAALQTTAPSGAVQTGPLP